MKRKRARSERYLTVDLSHIDLLRGGHRVLRDVHWRIRPGQRWVLQGANGAGKTQLLKLIAGDVWPQPLAKAHRRYRWRGESFPEPYGIKEEIAYLGAERQDRYQHYDWDHRVTAIVGTGIERSDTPTRSLRPAERTRVARLLSRFGIQGLGRRRFLTLSQGERRLVLLARALAWRPALLLLDEPLNGLDATHRERVLAALGTLSRSRLPWIYASHRIEEVPAAATHRACLQRGRLRTARWRGPPAKIPGSVQKSRTSGAAPRSQRPSLLVLRDASVWRGERSVLRHLAVQIRQGECWVVHGANGSGKSTLLATMYGECGVTNPGSIWRRDLAPEAALSDFQRHVGYVTPELQAALPRSQTALECVVAGMRGAHRLDGTVRKSERRGALQALGEQGARALARRPFGELSYGQARRVVFARALAGRPDIVLLDEPYTGLDAATRRRLRRLIDAHIAAGGTVVIASHHRDDRPQAVTHEIELADGVARYCGPLRTGQVAAGLVRL